MSDFVQFFQTLGFPAGVAAAALWIMYRVGSKLVDRHIQTLSVIEGTQREMAEAISRIISLLDRINERITKD